MPNTRRRRFSVQSDQNKQKPHRTRNNNNTGKLKPPLASTPTDDNTHRNKTRPHTSYEGCTRNGLDKGTASRTAAARVDKDVAATSSNIDLYHYMRLPDDASAIHVEVPEPRDTTSAGQDDVRDGVEERSSQGSVEEMCRICHGGSEGAGGAGGGEGGLVSACRCRGSVGRVHVRCLERWLTEAGKSRCELCRYHYRTQRVHRYGLPRALFVWLFTHSAKQLMVDGLGLALMSPLAAVAAWLSGRTLSALLAHDPRLTPWPLASTFVLACMTLVCYYCWVVSAATRHALSWWSWYRAHYRVTLQLPTEQPQDIV